MANIQRKTISVWDGGIKTSSRESLQNTSDGAQMIKGFDVYKDPKKLIPMQSWESFTTDEEKALGIRAMGGQSDRVYGLGNALKGWYGADWLYRIKVSVAQQHHLANMPLWLDMSRLPNDFWTNANADMSDVRVTSTDGETGYSVYTENVDTVAKTGDMWIKGDVITQGTPTITTIDDYNGTGSIGQVDNSTKYAESFPITLTGLHWNTVKINLKKSTNAMTFSNIICDLYTDNVGVPGTKVQELGQIDYRSVDTITRDFTIATDDVSLTGSYHLVFHCTTLSGGTIDYTYSNTGTIPINYASNVGLTAWAAQDSTATPNYELLNIVDATAPVKYFYIYYGNSSAQVVPYGFSSFDYLQGGRYIFSDNSTRWNYTFGDESLGNRYYNGGDSGTEAFTTAPQTFSAGLFGKTFQTFGSNIITNNNDDVGLQADQVSFSFLIKISAGANIDLYQNGGGNWKISLDTNRKILFFINGTLGNTTKTSTIALSVDTWHVVDCVFNGNYYITIDGVKETFADNDGNYDGNPTNDYVIANTGNVAKLAQLVGYDNDLTDNQITTKFNNFTNPYFYTSIGSEEDLAYIEKNYDGFQLYYKLISSGGWREMLESGRPVRYPNFYPTNSWIDDSGTYFILSQEPENQGFLFVAKVDTLEVVDPSFVLLSVLSSNGSKICLQSEVAQGDTTLYYNYGSSAIGDVGTASEQTFMSTVTSLASWRTYLAACSTYRNRANIEIWDLSNASNAITERVDIGTGNARIVGNASDILFAVVDNFIDNEIKSTGKPTMEIRQYTGNGESKKTHVLEIPVNIDDSTYTDNWERAVSSFKIRRNAQTLFYARLPQDSTGLTFNEGFWSVGKNSRGELSLTLQIDTAGLGMPENVFAFAQQVFFIAKDGGIYRLANDAYENTALFKSLKFNEGNTEIEKKLIGVEVITEPLEDGQTISMYYKKHDDTDRTKIFDMTGEGEISYETTYDINEANLPHYKEIEFEVESTGGKSAILEVAYKYEYLSNVV